MKVSHDGKPLARVSVHVSRTVGENSKDWFTGRTDNRGSVRVPDLPPGDYWLTAELLGIGAATQCFHVGDRPSSKAKSKLKYDWGDLAPSTRAVAGKLIDAQPGTGGTSLWNLLHTVDVPVIAATLKAQNAMTGAVYRATSAADGSFAFETIPDGTYVLHIEGGKAGERDYDGTDLLLKVSATAKRNMLLLARRVALGGCAGTSLEVRSSSN